MNEQKVASERLATFGNHLTMIAHREADGEAEMHETQADFFFVQSGTATLVYGGEMVGRQDHRAGRAARAVDQGRRAQDPRRGRRRPHPGQESPTNSSSPRARSSRTS